MTNHWNQSRSSFRTGEPADHLRAKEFIGAALFLSAYDVHYEFPLVDSLYKNYRHNYDIVAFKNVLVVEIDDPNLHSKPRKKANDLTAENNVASKFPHAKFIRLDKYEVNNDETFDEYLNKELWPHIK